MKRKFIVLLIVLLVSFGLFGCGKTKDEDDVIKELEKKYEDLSSYHMNGAMEIVSGDDLHEYDVDVSYNDEDLFRVSLMSKTTNQEQIILKNNEGVFVLTPALNKSFKFQSEWPYNNSQAYLYHSFVGDIIADTEREYMQDGDMYVFMATATYPNNKSVVKQIVYFDKNLNPIKVEVKDENDIIVIKVLFDEVEFNRDFEADYFATEKNMEVAKENIVGDEEVSYTINEIMYPLYIPVNTYLETEDVLDTDEGERVILTFDGDKPFTLIQENADLSEVFEVIPYYGEPADLGFTVGALTDTSLSFFMDGMEYYIVSESLTSEEFVSVASSITSLQSK